MLKVPAYTRIANPLCKSCKRRDRTVKDFYEFNKDSFKLENYRYNPFDKKIEIAI